MNRLIATRKKAIIHCAAPAQAARGAVLLTCGPQHPPHMDGVPPMMTPKAKPTGARATYPLLPPPMSSVSDPPATASAIPEAVKDQQEAGTQPRRAGSQGNNRAPLPHSATSATIKATASGM